MDPEKEAMEEYKKEGVEFTPEAEAEAKPKAEEKPEEEEKPSEEEPEAEEEAEPEVKPEEESEEEGEEEEGLETEPQKPKKRSIYKNLKEKKALARTEGERADRAEEERDELQRKLDAKPEATPVADDDLTAFAKEINADPASLQKMRTLFQKDSQNAELPEGFQEQMQQFQDWQKSNNEAVEEVQFNREFKSVQPELTKMFGKTTPEEADAIKDKIQELAHTEAFHDKEIDYIAFKNQKTLTALISPKKRGLEGKGKTDAPADGASFKFDPNADLSKMSEKESIAWQAEYDKATASQEGLETDGEGRSVIL